MLRFLENASASGNLFSVTTESVYSLELTCCFSVLLVCLLQ